MIDRILRKRPATRPGVRSAPKGADIPAATTFLDPTTLAKIGNLELLARTVVEGFINGLHRSPQLGMSTDFAEYRPYMVGDDIRRIDWRLYARTDRLYIKEFEASTSTNFSVLLDVSASMGYGSGAVTKLDYAKYLTACLAYFSHDQRDRVGIVTFDTDPIEIVPPSSRHLSAVLHAIARARAGERARENARGDARGDARAERTRSFDRPLRAIAEQFRRKSMLLVVSDLYAEPSVILAALRHLRQQGNDIMVIHVLDPAELDFPFDVAAPFEDVETGERMAVVPQYLREQYQTKIRGHIDALKRALEADRMDYAVCDTSKPLDYMLFNFLSARQRLLRVR